MKKSSFITILFVAISGLAIFTVSSCSKTTDANKQYIGNYYGTSILTPPGGSNSDTIVITAGANGNAIVMTDHYGGTIVNATVSGNIITVPDQTVYINMGGPTAIATQVAGAGTLSGTALYVALNDTITNLGSGTYVVNDTKQ